MMGVSKWRRVLVGALAGALPAVICGVGVGIARQDGIHPYGHDLDPMANIILYLITPMGCIWVVGGALLALNGRLRVLIGALAGALPGAIGSPLVFVLQGGCAYWVLHCFGDVLLLVVAFASMTIGVSLGAFVGWIFTHRGDMRRLVDMRRLGEEHGIREVVRGAWMRLQENGVTKCALCGTAPGLIIAMLLFLWGGVNLLSQPYASFYGESVIFFAVMMLSIATSFGQLGALEGWFRARRKIG